MSDQWLFKAKILTLYCYNVKHYKWLISGYKICKYKIFDNMKEGDIELYKGKVLIFTLSGTLILSRKSDKLGMHILVL